MRTTSSASTPRSGLRVLVCGLGAAALLTGTMASATPTTPKDAASDDDLPFSSAAEPEEAPIPEPAPAGEPEPDLLEAPLTEGGAAADAPAQPVDDGPLTGFEQRGGADWTTLAEERSFLREVDEGSDLVSISRAGTTLEGRRLDLVQIGAEPRTPGEVAAGSSVFYTCAQHGNEPAGRESCLQMIRDLAFDDSPATRRLLQRSTILVIPTVNPDGVAANTRGNSEGVDINRDHLALQTLEGQAIARVLRDYGSQVVHDAHEYGGRQDVYERDLIRLWPRNLNVDEAVREVAIEHAEDYIDPLVQYEGFTTGDYGIWYDADGRPIAQVAGNEDERIMRNTVGLKHRAGQLTESLVNDFDDDETETENRIRRVRTHLLANQATLDLALEQGGSIRETSLAAADAATERGANGDRPFFFAGADNALPPPDAVDLAPPCAYQLSVEEFRTIRQTLTLHGVETTRRGQVVTVSMAQPAQPLIPLLLDERANFSIAEATPVACD